jgi:5-oxoprolinase (ATP-hydrolysing)
MRHVQDAAEQKMRRALEKLPDGRREFVDHLDDGSPIAVAVTITGSDAKLDFTGTGGRTAQRPKNNNASKKP